MFRRESVPANSAIHSHITNAMATDHRDAAARSKRTSQISTERTDVRSLATVAFQIKRGKALARAAFRHKPLAHNFERFDMNATRLEFNFTATICQVASAMTVNFHGTIIGRNLVDIANELRQNTFQVFAGHRRRTALDPSTSLRFAQDDTFRMAFNLASLVSRLWTFALLKSQMLGSVISMQAWLRLSPYAFVVLTHHFPVPL